MMAMSLVSGTSRRSWYADGLQFECRRCGRCCCGSPGYVWVTRVEAGRIAAYLGTDRDGFVAKYMRRIGRRYSLRERRNGDCVFYADGCIIYPVRPAQCRTFPFWPENLTSRPTWRGLAEGREGCPGIDRGRAWTRAEIELLSGRSRPRRRAVRGDLGRALRGLLRLYAELDAEIAPLMETCSGCGACCDFATHDHVLFVTELERALLVARRGSGNPDAVPGRCPYQAGAVCSARDVRPLGCRTFFCDEAAGERGRRLHETWLRRMMPLRERCGLALSYAPLLNGGAGDGDT